LDVPFEQRRTDRLGDLERQHGLAGAGLALDQERTLERDRGVDRDLEVVGRDVGARSFKSHDGSFRVMPSPMLDRFGGRLSRPQRRPSVMHPVCQGRASRESIMRGKSKRGLILLVSLVGLLPPAAEAGDERKQLAFEVVDRNAEQMAAISDSIFYFGEPGMQEFEGTKLLKGTLEVAGFRVELGGAGMPTNLWAEWGSGHPKIAIVTEIDALPSGSQKPLEFTHTPLVAGAPGHMEGHNTHGGVASTAAFAVKQVMQRFNIPGTVAISFGPAEEQL